MNNRLTSQTPVWVSTRGRFQCVPPKPRAHSVHTWRASKAKNTTQPRSLARSRIGGLVKRGWFPIGPVQFTWTPKAYLAPLKDPSFLPLTQVLRGYKKLKSPESKPPSRLIFEQEDQAGARWLGFCVKGEPRKCAVPSWCPLKKKKKRAPEKMVASQNVACQSKPRRLQCHASAG